MTTPFEMMLNSSSHPNLPSVSITKDEPVPIDLFYFRSNTVYSMVKGIKERLKENTNKLNNAKGNIEKRKIKHALIQEKFEKTFEEIIKLKESILSTSNELDIEETKILNVENILNNTKETINKLEKNSYIIDIFARRKILSSTKNGPIPSALNNNKKRASTISDRKLLIKSSRTAKTIQKNSIFNIHSVEEAIYHSKLSKLFIHILTCLQNTCNIDHIFENSAIFSNSILDIHENLSNKLVKIKKLFTMENTNLTSKYIENKQILETLIQCSNNIENFVKDLENDIVFEKKSKNTSDILKTRQSVKLNINSKEYIDKFANNLKELTNQQKEPMIIYTDKLIKTSSFEVHELLHKIQDNIKNVSNNIKIDLKVKPDFTNSENIELSTLIDLVLETQISLSNPSSLYINNIFCSTFYYYISTKELMDYLLCKYCATYKSNFNIDKKAMEFAKLSQYQVISLINQLICHYPYYLGLNSKELSYIELFIRDIIPIWHQEKSLELLKTLNEEKKKFESNLISFVEFIKIISMPTTLSNFDVYKSSPRLFAYQLTIFEFELFSRLRISEFSQQNWIHNKKIATGLLYNAKHFNSIVNYIIRRILEEDTIIGRGKLLRFFVITAMHLYKLNNFNGLFEILSALNSIYIFRLNLSWKEAGDEIFGIFQQFAKLWEKNYEIYRDELSYIKPPAIPYVGLYLTDLTFIEDGNATSLCDKVNFFFKFGKIMDIFTSIQIFQSINYEDFLDDRSEWVAFFSSLQTFDDLDEDKYYSISISLESLSDANNSPLPTIISEQNLNKLRFHSLLQDTSIESPRKKLKRSKLKEKVKTPSRSSTREDIDVPGLSPNRSPSATMEQIGSHLKHPTLGIKLKSKSIEGIKVKVFSSESLINWMMENMNVSSKPDAIDIGRKLVQRAIIIPTNEKNKEFIEDNNSYYSLSQDYESFFSWDSYESLTEEDTFSRKTKGFVTDTESLSFLSSLIKRMQHPQLGIKLKDKKSSFLSNKTKECFTGEVCITWIVQNMHSGDRSDAISIGNNLIKSGLICSLTNEFKTLKDKKSAYYYFKDSQ